MIYEFKGIRPRLGKDVFLAPGAIILGDVEIGDGSNLWFYTVARGDVNRITIGRNSNIQDQCMLHVTGGQFPLTVGDEVVVGHRVVLHGCTIHDRALIGMGALVLDGAVVEPGAIVAAGAVVTPGSVIPENTLAVGIPARPSRQTTAQQQETHSRTLAKYGEYARTFAQVVEPVPWPEINRNRS